MRRFALRAFALSGIALAAAAIAAAAAPSPERRAALDRTVRYLQESQQPNGGFGASGEPSQISSAWTALALAAAGINPQDQARPGGVDAYSYLVSHYRDGIEETECAPIACTTTLERELMVVNASGTSPHDFGGVDLVAELLDRADPEGWFPHVPGGGPGVNDTVFAVFALAPVQEPQAQEPIQRAADWIEAAQLENGGWTWSATSTQDEVDLTGAAIQALVAAGRPGSDAVEDGLAYLRAAQGSEGGLPDFPGPREANVASTAWAVQAIWAVGENPEGWTTGSGEPTEEPLDYLESMQEPDGHIRWKRSRDLNGVWMTAYVAPAFAGQAWPIPAAPRAIRTRQAEQQARQGGDGSGRDGVLAGGGGRGAPLFSRPRPQSRGKTPGGARRIGDEGARPTDHSASRRGENAIQPAGTPTREASAAGAVPALAGEGGDGESSSGSGLGSGGSSGEERGEPVTGTLVGGGGKPFFGAPGLRGAGAGEDDGAAAALGIGAAALLLGLLGAWVERRRPWAPAGAPA
jgi:squalene-hopene cyclase-like protein/prenyltransferase/squalene oxidase-like repeat protein